MNVHRVITADAILAQSCGDVLAFGAIICDARAHVLYANAAAEALVDARAGLVLRGTGRLLSANNPLDTRRLLHLIGAACSDCEPGSMILPDASHALALTVLVTPLSLGTTGAEHHALLAIRSLNESAAFDEKRLAALFKLSPAQAALALALYEGKSFEEIAVTRNVKVTTLRTHFAEVLNRTGSTGLRDLTRRLGMIPPLR